MNNTEKEKGGERERQDRRQDTRQRAENRTLRNTHL